MHSDTFYLIAECTIADGILALRATAEDDSADDVGNLAVHNSVLLPSCAVRSDHYCAFL